MSAYQGENWKHFDVGQMVAGMEIVKLLQEHAFQRCTYYEIRYQCCGETEEVSHQTINRRIRKATELCSDCRYRLRRPATKRKGRPFGSWYHGWEPPPSALRVPVGWMPR